VSLRPQGFNATTKHKDDQQRQYSHRYRHGLPHRNHRRCGPKLRAGHSGSWLSRHTQATNTRTTKIKTNTNIIEHAVEVHAFTQANLKTTETRKALYDGLERDLKAIFREVTGFDLFEGYYLKFNKNDDGSWKTDFYVSIKEDDEYWKTNLYFKNREVDEWTAINEVEKLYDKGFVGNFPCHLQPIFGIEAEDPWSKKSKLSIGSKYADHYYLTAADRQQKLQGDFSLPELVSYSQLKQLKGSQECGHSVIKTKKAYLVFKLYVAQFFARNEEIKAGYEKAKAIIEPHREYLAKLKNLKVRNEQINYAIHKEHNPDAEEDAYVYETIRVGSEQIWLRGCDLHSPENIDIVTQILELLGKVKFQKKLPRVLTKKEVKDLLAKLDAVSDNWDDAQPDLLLAELLKVIVK